MKIALIILAVIVVGIVGILTFATTKPDVFIVQRTATWSDHDSFWRQGAEHAHRHKRTHTSANGQHKKRRNAANETNLDDLAMSEVNPLPESDTEFVAC
jgi:hypothetical protein